MASSDEQEEPILARQQRYEPTMDEDELIIPGPRLSVEAKRRIWWRNAFVNALYIASWFLFATLLSLYNKWMFTPDYFNFPFPLLVTTMHMATQFLLAGAVRKIWPHVFNPPGRPTMPEYIKKCIPCGIATGLDIGLSNLSLKTITLSLYTMCKSSSLIFVLFFAFILKLERFSVRLVAVILLITAGVLLMVLSTDVSSSAPPTKPSTIEHATLLVRAAFDHVSRGIPAHLKTPVGVGVILVLSASACGGLRWALTQKLLTGAHGPSTAPKAKEPPRRTMGLNNPAATIFWLSPTMFFTLLSVAFFVEGPFPSSLTNSGFFDSFGQGLRTIVYIFIPGAIAFAMVMSEYYIIQRTGVVPMSIAGIFKEVTTILLSTWFFGDTISLINWIGLLITFAGIVIFTHYKYQKSVRESAEEDDSPSSSQDIALPAYSAIAPEEMDTLDEMEADSSRRRKYTDIPLSGRSDALPDDYDEALRTPLFDAGAEDEISSRQRESLEDVLIPDAQYASAFSPITPDPPPSRAGKKKVRFDVEEPPTEPEPNGASFGS